MKGDQLQGAETVTSLSIVRRTTTDEGERIDYRVKMYNPETGGQIDVRNNEIWSGTALT